MTIAYKSSGAALVPISERVGVYADALVRLTAGLLLMPHGAQKLFGLFGGPGLDGARAMFETKLGLPPWLAVVAGVIEFFGGAMLALGIATRPVALIIAAQLFFVVFAVHWHAGLFAQKGGFEYPLLWAVVALSYALKGGGHCSLDTLIFGDKSKV
ncbi:MAG TPA: DoxX family protein [Methylocystis sp.]|nr:DoxX family protein [Methylocystis sp.]